MRNRQHPTTAPVPVLIGALLLGVLCLPMVSAAMSTRVYADDDWHSVSVSGQGEIRVTPDTADITLSFSEEGKSVAPLQQQIDTDVSGLLAYLEQLGVADGKVQAANLNIQPRYRYDNASNQRLSDGYRVSRDIRLTLEDLGKLGKLLTEVADLGVDGVSPPQLSFSGREQAYQQALELAFDQARTRAEVLASSAGRRIGAAAHISAGGGARPSPMPVARAAMVAEDSAAASYTTGDMTIRASVNVVFTLQD